MANALGPSRRVRLIQVTASKAFGHESIAITESACVPESFAAIQDATDRRAALLPVPAGMEIEK